MRKAIRVGRVFGSAALAMSYLADARFDSYIQPRGLSLGDIAAAGLIAQQAGVTVTDGEGGPWFDLRRKSAASASVESYRRVRSFSRHFMAIQSRSPRTR